MIHLFRRPQPSIAGQEELSITLRISCYERKLDSWVSHEWKYTLDTYYYITTELYVRQTTHFCYCRVLPFYEQKVKRTLRLQTQVLTLAGRLYWGCFGSGGSLLQCCYY